MRRTALFALAAAALAACATPTETGAPLTPEPPEDPPAATDAGEATETAAETAAGDVKIRGEEEARSVEPAACPGDAEGLEHFDWPPPRPSAVTRIPLSRVLGESPRGKTKLDVSERLEGALIAAGFVEYSFYQIECDGFALVTGLERIKPDGSPADDALRFAPPEQGAPFSLTGYIRSLFVAPPGFYRNIVFAVTDERYIAPRPAPTASEMRDAVRGGASYLGGAYGEVELTSRDAVYALIYEFQKGGGGEQVSRPTPAIAGAVIHLQKSGIYRGLSETD